MGIKDDFFRSSSIPRNQDTENIIDFLMLSESVLSMMVMTKVGLPALAGVVKELENRYSNSQLFPLNHDAEDSNAPNRRNVGWMVRFIMREYGYTPVKVSSAERTRIPKFVGSQYFSTSAIYEKTNLNPKHSIELIQH